MLSILLGSPLALGEEHAHGGGDAAAANYRLPVWLVWGMGGGWVRGGASDIRTAFGKRFLTLIFMSWKSRIKHVIVFSLVQNIRV